jgi:hypothetical protein
MRKNSLSERLRKKGAGKEIVAEVQELEAIASVVESIGGVDMVRFCAGFTQEWGAVINDALKEKGGKA